MKKILILGSLLSLASLGLLANEDTTTCYNISGRGLSARYDSHSLCLHEREGTTQTLMTKEGMRGDISEILQMYRCDLESRARCLDCNQDVYRCLDDDARELKIRFKGKRNIYTYAEKGTLSVGRAEYSYSSK